MITFPLAAIRPDTRYTWCGPSTLIIGTDGWAGSHPLSGFYFRQARFLRTLQLQIKGEPPHVCSIAETAPHELELSALHPEVREGGGGGSGSGRIGMHDGMLFRNLDIRVRYTVRPASLRVTLLLGNRWQDALDLELAWLLAADYASVDDAQFDRAPDPSSTVVAAEGGVDFRCQLSGLPFETHVRARDADAHWRNGALHCRMRLPRQDVQALTLDVRAVDGMDGIDAAGEARRMDRLQEWRARVARVHAPAESPLVDVTARAASDIGSFAMLEGPENEWLTPAAGAPVYLTMWGRDALTTAWQAGILDGGDMLADTLDRVARLQGTRIDAVRDEQPGRMINQAKLDPASRLGDTPFGRDYADVASPFMFIIGLGYQYFLTGDRATIRKHWDAAQRVLQWADTYGDRDGDGYIEYLTKSPFGPTHQGWKDSENAVVDAAGEPVNPPIAPCEIQGYWFISLQYLALFSLLMGERTQARELWQRSRDLRARFNRDFWMEDEGFIAFGLDADKQPIRAVTSNAGQCLPTGIVSSKHVPRLVRRLFAPDLFSGWGIRTLSSQNPAYNPLDYHLGSVWPVENATILFGLRRYGLNERALELTRALYDLARLWPGGRIPECVGGYARHETAHPGAYPRANVPQAWNQSVWPIVVQSLLGLVPCAPLRMLLVDPVLPSWLPELTVKDMRVGSAVVTLRCWRNRGGSSRFEVLAQEGDLKVLRQPWLESQSANLWDRLMGLTQTALS